MRSFLRQAALLTVSAVLSWWFILRVPPAPAIPRTISVPPQALEVTPIFLENALAPAPDPWSAPSPPPIAASQEILPPAKSLPDPEPEAEPAPEASAPAPPPPELGAPEGEEPPGFAPAAAEVDPPAQAADDAVAREETVVEEQPEEPVETAAKLEAPPAEDAERAPEPSRGSVEALMRDPGLLAEARAEFVRGHSKGFATVLLAAPEDQLAIARFFGEELVLVPRRALDPDAEDPGYFRMTGSGEPRVEAVEGAPPLERFRQYRDLFDYEYSRLPSPLRDLRRSVLARGEIYLFAALLSAEEWALVIARRQEALALAGRELADVRRFILRYLHRPEDGFDLAVDEIVFADGTRFRPAERGTGQ